MSPTQVMVAFIGGVLSFFSPCILPVIPLYLGYLGATMQRPGRNLARMLPFVLGFTLVFIALGMTATGLGRFLIARQVLLKEVSGIIIMIMGIWLSGLLPVSGLQRQFKINYVPGGSSWLTSLLFGVVFALGWTPCVGPILASILIYASSARTVAWGGVLLALYSLGIAVPLLLVAYFADLLLPRLTTISRWIRYLQIGGGLLMVILGVLMLMGRV